MSENLDKMMYSFVMEDVLKGFFIKVPPGYVACVYDLGRGVLKKVLRPGLHLKVPFWQKAKLFNTQTLEYNISKNFDINKIKVKISSVNLNKFKSKFPDINFNFI